MDDQGGSLVSDGATFVRSLDALKQEGSNILIVGTDAAEAHEMACQRLLGEADRDAVYRLHVTGETSPAACEGTCGSPETERFRTIDYSTLTAEPETDSVTDEGRPPLTALGIEIVETVDEFAAEADGLAPADLRICVDSLVPLCHEYEIETVFRLLHMATLRVDQGRGMGHYHLPLAREHNLVHLFEPLFDAVITVRSRDGIAEHRWSLRNSETTTDWLKLSRLHSNG